MDNKVKTSSGVFVGGALAIASVAYVLKSRSRSSSKQSNTIPTKMKKLFLMEPNSDLNKVKLQVQEVDVPQPKPGEVLVKMSASPVNPSDYGRWRAGKKSQEPSSPVGIEGSGVVVASGGGWSANRLLNKTVGVLASDNQGTYAEYVCVNALRGAFVMSREIGPADAASFFVNPFTALAILDTAKTTYGAKALIHTAAASQLGQMMVKLSASQKDMTVVNLVRRQEQVELLRKLGATHIVCTNDKDWQDQLSSMIQELNITVAFDAIAGEMPGTLVSLLPSGGTCLVYGGLSKKPVEGVDVVDLIYGKKEVKGFYLGSWIEGGGSIRTLARLGRANKMVNEGLKAGGWAESSFVDCRLEDMQSKFLELVNKEGFTGKKLRIRMD